MVKVGNAPSPCPPFLTNSQSTGYCRSLVSPLLSLPERRTPAALALRDIRDNCPGSAIREGPGRRRRGPVTRFTGPCGMQVIENNPIGQRRFQAGPCSSLSPGGQIVPFVFPATSGIQRSRGRSSSLARQDSCHPLQQRSAGRIRLQRQAGFHYLGQPNTWGNLNGMPIPCRPGQVSIFGNRGAGDQVPIQPEPDTSITCSSGPRNFSS